MDFSIFEFYEKYWPLIFFLKLPLHICNRKNQLPYELIFEMGVIVYEHLLFELITTMCNMI